MHLAEIGSLLIDDGYKGVPPGTMPFRLSQMGSIGWNVLREDFSLPLAVLKQSALENNSRWMRRFVESTGVKLAPHGKTTMSPQLFARQLADGAWGITLATIQQVRIARRFGISRVLLANQLVSRPAIDYVLDELTADPQFEFLCLVDSLAGVERLASVAQARTFNRSLEVLVEGGILGARCGSRDLESALTVAREVRKAWPNLVLRGVEGFEGSIKASDAPTETEGRVREYLKFLVEIARGCAAERLFGEGPVILSAGGSAFFDLVAEEFAAVNLGRDSEVILRGGCYLTHDSAFYRRQHERLLARSSAAANLGPGLLPALEVWAYVQSRPEPTRAVLTLGKRDISFDLDLPLPQQWYRPELHAVPQPIPPEHRLASLNDQHALMDLPAGSPLAVGDMVACGISHPCTTFDRWQLIPVVDDGYNVVSGIRTFF